MVVSDHCDTDLHPYEEVCGQLTERFVVLGVGAAFGVSSTPGYFDGDAGDWLADYLGQELVVDVEPVQEREGVSELSGCLL